MVSMSFHEVGTRAVESGLTVALKYSDALKKWCVESVRKIVPEKPQGLILLKSMPLPGSSFDDGFSPALALMLCLPVMVKGIVTNRRIWLLK